MSQPVIPDNNLPIYLQQYDVNILNVDIPECLIGGCPGTQFGCCCDGITSKVDEEGSNCIGGCCGTQFGCCPYSTKAKEDKEGSNCGTIAGSVLYTTVGAIPSNQLGKRVWQLNLTGNLKPNMDTYYIVYDFSKVNYQDKDGIKFEDILSGTFNICGNVLDASKYLNYKFCNTKSTLTIIMNTRKWDFRLKKEVLFSYDININDASCSGCICSKVNTNKDCSKVSKVLDACLTAPLNNTGISYTWDSFCYNSGSETDSSAFWNNTTCTSSDEVCVFGKLYATSPTTGDTLQIVFSEQAAGYDAADIIISFLTNGKTVSTQKVSFSSPEGGPISISKSYEGVSVNITSIGEYGGAPVKFNLSETQEG